LWQFKGRHGKRIPKDLISKSGKTTTKWYVGYYLDDKHRSKSAGDSKTVALKLKKRIEAELESGSMIFSVNPRGVANTVLAADFLHRNGAVGLLQNPNNLRFTKSRQSHRNLLTSLCQKALLSNGLLLGEAYAMIRR